MNRRSRRIPTLLMAVVATLAVGAGAGAVAYSSFSSPDTTTVVRQVPVRNSEPAASTSPLTIGEIYRSSYKGVVEITVTLPSSGVPFGQGNGQTPKSQGSGFVYDSKGNVVTNEHVVDGARSISVRFWNGDTYKANVVGSDPSTDLAVIKVDAPQSILSPLTVGDSSKLLVGDGVVAIGSPFGLEETVTSGIVSALHRQMEAPNDFTINDSIQTDAAINHGNSGGPLLNAQGEVIGVNAQIAGDGGGNVGVGFAIPSNTIHLITTQLIGTGKAEHAYLGVSVVTIPATIASDLALVEGVELRKVTGGTPAAKAGLRSSIGTKSVDGDPYPIGGDVITAFDGKKVTTSEELQRAVDSKRPGDTVSVTYWREGKTHTTDVTLDTRPSRANP
ncbi:MAG: trypsin-like peptidase domain-containing protein [Actinomycetota bacterium]